MPLRFRRKSVEAGDKNRSGVEEANEDEINDQSTAGKFCIRAFVDDESREEGEKGKQCYRRV